MQTKSSRAPKLDAPVRVDEAARRIAPQDEAPLALAGALAPAGSKPVGLARGAAMDARQVIDDDVAGVGQDAGEPGRDARFELHGPAVSTARRFSGPLEIGFAARRGVW